MYSSKTFSSNGIISDKGLYEIYVRNIFSKAARHINVIQIVAPNFFIAFILHLLNTKCMKNITLSNRKNKVLLNNIF